MKFTKRNTLISVVIILAAVLYQWISTETIQRVPLANTLFLIALPLLIIGLFGLVLSKGTFDFFHYSMKTVSKKRKNQKNDKDFTEGNEEENREALSGAVGKSYQSILTIGFIVLIISIVLLWDYFL